MQILGYVIVKTVMGYELRVSEFSDQFVYRNSSFGGVMEYLRANGYPEPPYEIKVVIESW